MKRSKMIIAAVVLMLVLLVGGLIAYFTDSDTTTNTFTIGNVNISLSEPSWVATNGQNVMPGQVIAKDPTITNDSTTNPAYVFMKVEIPCSTDSTPIEAFTLNNVDTSWYLLSNGACTSGKATKVYAYGTSSAMTSLAASTSTPALFDGVTVNTGITNPTSQGLTGNLNVVVTGYGIQTQGLSATDPASVWSNFS